MITATEQENINIAYKWFQAFNEHDPEKLLTLYNEDAAHFSPKLKIRQPETNGMIVGKPQLRAWWKDSFYRLPSLVYEPVQITANEERVFIEYRRKVNGEPDLMVGEVLEISDGLISASRVYHG